jgi:hypothetical protein
MSDQIAQRADQNPSWIIDAWAQPVRKDGVLPEVACLLQQSGAVHWLGQDLEPKWMVREMDLPDEIQRRFLWENSARIFGL